MKKLLSLILAVMMVISAFSVTALADGMNSLDLAPIGEAAAPAEQPTEEPAAPAEEPVQEAEQPEEAEVQAAGIGGAVPFAADKNIGVDGLFTLTYTAASEGNIEEVGTAARSGGTGKAYVITLPEDTEIKAFAALQESATFSGIGRKRYSNGIPSVKEYIKNAEFQTNTNPPQYRLHIYKATTFKSGYQLPVRAVEGFGIYVENKTAKSYDTVFVQIKTKIDVGMEGKGTKENPYIIQTSENLKTLSEQCNNGNNFNEVYFKISDDVESITLPENWKPIGMPTENVSPTGAVYRIANHFSGNFNGNGKTIIVPDGSLSLFGSPRGGIIENLSIYGEKIPGYGLFESYMVGSTGTIKNITIKSGSHILKSGLLGGFGNTSVNIYDCTIEKGVIIGDDGTWGDLGDTTYAYDFVSRNINHQDMIGSFCGAWNGTITNCVSYATVYGRNYVGGIVGFKGQSMRKCIVNNCAFYGDIIATGEGVGGIVGSGYLSGSAPNSPCVTIENCYAVGNIKGKDKVGGIFGGELGVDNNWGNGIGRVRGNYFSGTVSATGENASAGGVIGFMKAMDIFNDVQGNYFTDDCGAANGIGTVECIYNKDKVDYDTYMAYGRDDDPMTSEKVTKKVTRAQVANGELVKLLNSGKYGRNNWQQGSEYPVFGEGKHIIGITSTGLYDDSVNSPLEVSPVHTIPNNGGYESLYEKNILVKYSDGTQEIISASKGEFGGVDFNETQKVQFATLTYENYEITFGLKINKVATGKMKVFLQVLGDSEHGENGEVHTLKNGGLTEWLPMTEFDDVPNNYTVLAFINNALKNTKIITEYDMSNGKYFVKYNGSKLYEGTNGENSRWQFTINGVNGIFHSRSQRSSRYQYLSDGDVIVLYYTDDYTKENPTANYDEVKAVKELIEAIGTVTKDSGEAIAAARKAYDMLGDAEKSYVDNYDKLVKAEQIYGMIQSSNKPGTLPGGKTDGSSSGVIKISATGAAKGEQNPNTGAPAMSIAPAMLVLAAAALVLKKRG